MSGCKKRNLEDYLTSINDDCIKEILSWLKLDDLCAVSRTSKKLQNLAVREFKFKYREKPIYILEKDLPCSDITNIKSVRLAPNENYVKCFGRYIENVIVDLSNCRLNLDLVTFIQTYINQLPKRIEFRRGHFYITQSFAEGIKNILEKVECVIFARCYGKQVNFYNEILKHCKRIKHIEIEPSYHTHYDQLPPRLPLNEHPCLERFICNFQDTEMTENLKEFFRMNSSVTQVSCTFGKQISKVDIKKCFKAVAEHSKNLYNVYFAIEANYPKNNLALIENELKVLGDSVRIKRCELNLLYGIVGVESVASLAALTGLKCNGDSLQSLIDVNSPFTKMETLILTNATRLTRQIISDLLHMLPNLKILCFEKVYLNDELNLKDVATQFVRQWQRLREIYFYGYFTDERCEELYNIEFLNEERKKLTNACQLTIYLCSYSTQHFFKKLSEASLNSETNIVYLAPADEPPKLGIF